MKAMVGFFILLGAVASHGMNDFSRRYKESGVGYYAKISKEGGTFDSFEMIVQNAFVEPMPESRRTRAEEFHGGKLKFLGLYRVFLSAGAYFYLEPDQHDPSSQVLRVVTVAIASLKEKNDRILLAHNLVRMLDELAREQGARKIVFMLRGKNPFAELTTDLKFTDSDYPHPKDQPFRDEDCVFERAVN